ncbi:Mg2+ transporter -like Zinc transport [Cordyceps militaris]|uniref:Mg2+ transporter-like Zinc transport n=1 Tax=Cordyceps militaris TaxID=73501 RepID=A0A2H4SCU3_CORMI|nr:Mg2+ transporter -like Zinc transport [Cordyceps militaris]
MAVPSEGCEECGLPEIWLCGRDGIRHQFQQPLSALNLDQRDECFALVFARANTITECKSCRAELARLFSVPTFWWTQYCKRANGYFGSQEIVLGGDSPPGITTWARFLIKLVQGGDDYTWIKLNIMTHSVSAKNQIMMVFDATESTRERLLASLMDDGRNEEMTDLFWIYHRILNDVMDLHDQSIWGLRTHVRTVERSSSERSLSDKSSAESTADRPNYRKLHDLARHAIHIAETTATTINTIHGIVAAHGEYMKASTDTSDSFQSIARRVQNRLLLYSQVALGLQNRAVATKDRLHNEIQLSFNMVTQNDAATTIDIGLIAKEDSTVMRKIAYLTMVFLPATFVSAIFSTSFFNFNPELERWRVSEMFWVYWACSAPVTLVAIASFRFWGRA